MGTNLIFISYSHKDKSWLDMLLPHLEALNYQGIDCWYDCDIGTGQQWNSEIQKAVTGSKLAVCLVSENFLASSFIRDKEIPALQKAGVTLFPLLVDTCAWKAVPWLVEIQMYPGSDPLSAFDPAKQKGILVDFVQEIQKFFIKMDRLEQAQRMAQNQAYGEAIETLQHIRGADSEEPVIQAEIERLEQKQKQIDPIQELIRGLSGRVLEIRSIHKPVVQRLKKMAREETDPDEEYLLDLVKDFVSGDLSAEAFTALWQQEIAERTSKTAAPMLDALARRLAMGEIVPFLGPDVIYLSDLPLPASRELVKKLAQEADYEDFDGSLSMISQYYQMTGYGRSVIIKAVREALYPDSLSQRPNPLYDLLARINAPLIVISASYDDSLEHAFLKAGKRFVLISHTGMDLNSGQILLKYSEKAGPEPPCTAESISALGLMDKGYSILYRVCGCFGVSGAQCLDGTEPLTLSEEDFFSLARNLEKVIPSYLIRQFSRKSFLLLGHDLHEWQNRLMIDTILEKKNSREKSFAVADKPNRYEKTYWEFKNLALYEMGLKEFVQTLDEQITV